MAVTIPQLAEATGLDKALLEDLPDPSGQSYVKLINAAAKLTGDADFGLHVGERISPASYPVLGYTLMSCNTLSHALAQVTRYEEIIHNLGHFKLDVDQSTMKLLANALPDAESNRHVTESVLAGLRVLPRGLWSGPFRFNLFHSFTRHPAIPRNSPCIWSQHQLNAPVNTVLCSNEILAWPIAQADASLFPILKQHAERLLTLEAKHGVVDEVRKALSALMARQISSSNTWPLT